MNISGSNGNIAMILRLDIGYGVKSKKVSLSIWRPRLVPDLEKEEGVLLETFSVREADVMAFQVKEILFRVIEINNNIAT